MSTNYGQHCELSNFGKPGFAQLIVVNPERGLNNVTSENVEFSRIHFFTNLLCINENKIFDK